MTRAVPGRIIDNIISAHYMHLQNSWLSGRCVDANSSNTAASTPSENIKLLIILQSSVAEKMELHRVDLFSDPSTEQRGAQVCKNDYRILLIVLLVYSVKKVSDIGFSVGPTSVHACVYEHEHIAIHLNKRFIDQSGWKDQICTSLPV